MTSVQWLSIRPYNPCTFNRISYTYYQSSRVYSWCTIKYLCHPKPSLPMISALTVTPMIWECLVLRQNQGNLANATVVIFLSYNHLHSRRIGQLDTLILMPTKVEERSSTTIHYTIRMHNTATSFLETTAKLHNSKHTYSGNLNHE